MSGLRLLLLGSLLLLGGCLWPVREKTDQTIREMASHPFDVAPSAMLEEGGQPSKAAAPRAQTPPAQGTAAPPAPMPDVSAAPLAPATDVQTVAFMQEAPKKPKEVEKELQVPPEIPGSELRPIDFNKRNPQGELLRNKEGRPIPISEAEKQELIRQVYVPLPPLPPEPTPLPGPNGRPYTLADFQRLAAENSPTLRQAVADVENARGALVQAKTWTNPTFSYSASPTNNNSNAGAQGFGIDQLIHTGGKWKMGVAVAQKNLDNAELALKRARSDLSTNVRNAYFALIVAKETMRVNAALARFTDAIYLKFVDYLKAGLAASYEPLALRSSAFTIRLAYQNAIYTYAMAWKQLVATTGMQQLPLTEVAGRVDRILPYYDHDQVLAWALTHHTDVLTAQNSLTVARYNLKLAQITPLFPDIDVNFNVWKESTLAPYQIFYQTTVGVPVPIWDQNRGNVISAQAALVRASEESHRVDAAIRNNLAAAYANYQTNLANLEYYRRNILPDMVRAYRGVFGRRQADATAPFGDLFSSQQALVGGVTTYLGILGSLWSGVVSVADFLQTDDLFQMATPHELPELPDLDHLPLWPCPHGHAGGGPCACTPVPGAPPPAGGALPGQPVQAPMGGTVPPAPPATLPELPPPRKHDG
jgi:cobalt-zinc-cadmium efflux system outer membrane protein